MQNTADLLMLQSSPYLQEWILCDKGVKRSHFASHVVRAPPLSCSSASPSSALSAQVLGGQELFPCESGSNILPRDELHWEKTD